VQISEVQLSADLGVATAYFSLLRPDDDPAPVIEGLESATGFMRSTAARALRMRRVPELRFRHDDTAKRGAELGRLIDQARARDSG